MAGNRPKWSVALIRLLWLVQLQLLQIKYLLFNYIIMGEQLKAETKPTLQEIIYDI
jgi:phage shock protein PspC (stress-responsive transcriptional regulator)